METEMILREELFEQLRGQGAKLMGAGGLQGTVSGELGTGSSVAVPMPRHIVEDLKTAPIKKYYGVYHTLNARLNAFVPAGGGMPVEI